VLYLQHDYDLFIRCSDGVCRWFKFDDGDVSECRMNDDEELKNQCFGGDYSGEGRIWKAWT
jgi:hypothetical protein